MQSELRGMNSRQKGAIISKICPVLVVLHNLILSKLSTLRLTGQANIQAGLVSDFA